MNRGAMPDMTRSRPAATSYDALEQRVFNVEQGLQHIESGITALSAKIDERSRTSWPTLASFAGVLVIVMGGMGTLALRPNEAAITRLENKVSALELSESMRVTSLINFQRQRIDDLEKELRNGRVYR